MSFDFSLTTFSPKGKLLQIEYALKAVSQGKASLGICAKNGVVIATDKKINSSLIDEVNLNTFFPFCYGQKTIYRHVLTPLFIYSLFCSSIQQILYFTTSTLTMIRSTHFISLNPAAIVSKNSDHQQNLWGCIFWYGTRFQSIGTQGT